MFKTLFATPLSFFCLFSIFVSVFFATDLYAQEKSFTEIENQIILPSLLIKDLNGREIMLNQILAEKATQGIVLLHLWSPSCGECIMEIRKIDKIKESLNKKGMPIISIAEDRHGKRTVPAFIRRQAIDKKDIYIDENINLMKILKTPGVPTTYIVSTNGKVIAIHVGAINWTLK